MQLNKKGEGCIAFTFLRREISPVTHLQRESALLLNGKLEKNQY
jgi:hypothetical protein